MTYFGSAQDMMSMISQVNRDAELAYKLAPDSQRSIGYGDYFLRVINDLDGPLLIYGYIMTREEMVQSEKDCGAPAEEAEWTATRVDSSYARGFRYGWCYSVVEPDGELGFTHVTTMLSKISKMQFEYAKKRNWQ